MERGFKHYQSSAHWARDGGKKRETNWSKTQIADGWNGASELIAERVVMRRMRWVD